MGRSLSSSNLKLASVVCAGMIALCFASQVSAQTSDPTATTDSSQTVAPATETQAPTPTSAPPSASPAADQKTAVTPTATSKAPPPAHAVDVKTRIVTLGIVAIVLLAALAGATQLRPLSLLIGADGRYSNSQTQLALWFGAVALVYVSTVVLRINELGWGYVGGVGLPTNLTVLTGLSALSFGGAKAVTMQKVDSAATAAANAPDGTPPNPALDTSGAVPTKAAKGSAPDLLKDLFQNDAGNADIGDVQMIFVTLAAVVIFVLMCFNWMGNLEVATLTKLPDVDSALLSGFGIGQGAYLLKKAALPLGQG
jgi:hypothetical protein